jgi:hypothetical protein
MEMLPSTMVEGEDMMHLKPFHYDALTCIDVAALFIQA